LSKLPHIAITSGEPAGIGPDVCIQLANQHFDARLTLIGDAELLSQRAKKLRLNFSLPSYDVNTNHPVSILHIPTVHPTFAGKPDARNSDYVLKLLKRAVQGCLCAEFDAMTTAPIHKGIINKAGISFTGHTEFLAELTNTPQVVMMLVGGGMRIALATTHLPLSQVPAAISAQHLENTLRILHKDLVSKFGIVKPRILVAGLNPHAGEDGYLGTEEIRIINPVLQKLRNEAMDIQGALPADTMFSQKNIAETDAFLAMYHDQGLPVLKHASFGHGVNVTLGLPIIRTSVDHGTALDIAATGFANPGSMQAAVELAIELSARRQQ